MAIDLLPRGNVREFESWLIRQINFYHLHYNRLEAEKPDSPSTWTAHGELCTAVWILAEYTDRDPNEIHKVAGSYRQVREVIYAGRSAKKAIEKRYKELMEKENGT